MSIVQPHDGRPGRVLEITSTANPVVKKIRSLSAKKNREEDGSFMVEGLKLVTDAIENGWPVRTLVYAKNAEAQPRIADMAAKARARGTDILRVSEKVLSAISRKDNPQMVVGVFGQRWLQAAEMLSQQYDNGDVLIALDRVRDPGNLGTVIRTADAVGAKGVILIGETTDPYSLEATRASMGSIFNVGLSRISEAEFSELAKRFTGLVVGTHLEGARDFREVEWGQSPALIVMGNEQQGLTNELVKACNELVLIPMAGKADSLNLAIATAIISFESRRAELKMPQSNTGSLANGPKTSGTNT